MNAPPGYNLETMAAIADEVEAELLPLVGQDPQAYDRGELFMPPLKYMNLGVSAENLRIIAEPMDPAHMEPMMDGITQVYRQYPGMRAFAARGSIISSNDGGTRSVTLDVAGKIWLRFMMWPERCIGKRKPSSTIRASSPNPPACRWPSH